MSFYSARITHPTFPAEFSGAAVAGAVSAPVTSASEPAASGVWLRNDDDTEGVYVLAEGEAEGFVLGPTISRFFPVDNVNKLWVRRAGSSDVILSYHAS
jgi:hypothetical protein